LGSTYSILDGKTVTHHVTINHIVNTIYPELTDELIKTYVKDSVVTQEAACKTVDDYREYLRERYEFAYADISNDNLVSDILDYLLEKSEFTPIPEDELNSYVEDKYAYYIDYCKKNGFTIEAYLELEKITVDEFRTQLRKDGENLIKKTMIVNAIKELEGITLTEEAYQEYLEFLVVYYQFDSIDALKKSITELGVEETIKNDATYELVYKFLLNNQVLKIEQKDLYSIKNTEVNP
jgi:FKBP-type peptidyl-prolyl cis-trans isomerase (trigger factor)